MLKNFQRKPIFELIRNIRIRAKLRQHRGIVRRVANHQNIFVVFRGRTQHRRSAYIDIFDGERKRYVFAQNRLLERIEVYCNYVDGFYAKLSELCHMLGVVAHRKYAAMNRRVKRLYSAIETFRKTCNIGGLHNGHACIFECGKSAAGRYNFVAKLFKCPCKLNYSRLVRNAYQRPHSLSLSPIPHRNLYYKIHYTKSLRHCEYSVRNVRQSRNNKSVMIET